MDILRKRFALAAWLACLAVLVSALAPSISHAMNAKRLHERLQALALAHASEVCHSEASPSLAGLAGHSQHDGGDEGPAVHMEHCPFCLTHAGSFALLPGPSSLALPVAGASSAVPPLFEHGPRTLFAWSTAQPRAPPHFS